MIDKQTAKKFHSRCFVCRKKVGKGFLFHHLFYVNGDKTYRDFKRAKDYQQYIHQAVKNNPKQFMLLCKKHHHAIESMKRYNRDTLQRLIKAVRMSMQ